MVVTVCLCVCVRTSVTRAAQDRGWHAADAERDGLLAAVETLAADRARAAVRTRRLEAERDASVARTRELERTVRQLSMAVIGAQHAAPEV